ncbi:hypothetical protein PtA15_1A490 [Puccinia triticina]|uniref:Uncharacterized protein n=1 Tax=Puccinia triticina TaxID=208348 RepID=A0ABY7C7M2_9BASI|nr:uncharacterized protein PtA15_1A490 [Puccinia triticina]WAQ81151.1 hypothetical protein PtA15_1A490 [Puccinia triticina]WAR52043.1 hypothetical protein PtB15_1B482 [Puccinia triticina]
MTSRFITPEIQTEGYRRKLSIEMRAERRALSFWPIEMTIGGRSSSTFRRALPSPLRTCHRQSSHNAQIAKGLRQVKDDPEGPMITNADSDAGLLGSLLLPKLVIPELNSRLKLPGALGEAGSTFVSEALPTLQPRDPVHQTQAHPPFFIIQVAHFLLSVDQLLSRLGTPPTPSQY